MKPSMIFYPWKRIREGLIKLLDEVDEPDLEFQSFPGANPLGKLFLQIAENEDYWIHAVARKELPLDLHYELKDFPSLSAIKMKLKVSQERTLSFLESLKESDLEWRFKTPRGESILLFDILWHVLENELHYRGEISLTLEMLKKQGLDI